MRLALVAFSAAFAASASAAPPVDCPMRDAPYSSASPLIDILLNPQAKAVAERALPGIATRLPAQLMGTTPPSFAAILTLKEASGFLRLPSAELPAIDRELAAIPVTIADKIARCSRYDTDPPKLVIPSGRPRILLFEKINGFRDVPSVDAAHSAFVSMAARKGWALVTTEKGSAFTPAILRQFDAVIWNNISGDVLTLMQRRAFQSYMEQGGGFIGVHGSAGDPVYFWDWYVDTLLGARFAGHPMAPQFQIARIKIDDSAHPVAQGLPATWDMSDEWYSFKNNPRASGSRIIATLDETTYKPDGFGGQNLRMGDHPIAWSRCVGKGRMFYSAIGHRPERYGDPIYVQMLEKAVAWAGTRDAKGCIAPK
ncbi:ThuA domain-containing protein [Sphingomonas sp. SUN039]|uniref:ThuA domain-containing protein n=1 Tax=Sphingomonas sp. SUN039 TaxID=2937787 RepID=UPI0021642E2F|nr:ThuA domain-containing protein [Sphingomonas sp. SUN039]UVO55972.1 ThuA domain-containing protein [Sphingomonas sp. SUN039]